MRKYLMAIAGACALMIFSGNASLAGDNAYPLSNQDCVKCHLEQVKDIDQRGGLHKTEVGCLDCHEEHPPQGKNPIAPCSRCHEPSDQPHYAVENCQRCHSPHHPMQMDLDRIENVKPVCISCHSEPGQDVNAHPSGHSQMDCKQCHQLHGESTSCGECHDSHTPDMTYEDCLRCHKPHRPSAIEFSGVVAAGLCEGCHHEAVRDITERGRAHGRMECIECHLQHPPSETGVIPECAKCHSRDQSPHYSVGNCGTCHQPHHPLDISYTQIEPVTPVCLSCHEEPGRQMREHPSKHADFDCKECHSDHGQSSECIQCHEPHSANMDNESCSRCHQPHRPVPVTYGNQIPNSFCAGCHEGPGADLGRTPTAHRVLDCIYCHQKQHGTVTRCGTCHGRPHASDLHGKYPDCLRCHQDPHALIK